MAEYLDRFKEIEEEADEAARVAQDYSVKREIMLEKARVIFRKHWKGEAE